jgi:hypothetical protein
MPTAVEIAPPMVTVRRDGRRLVGPIAARIRDGEGGDHFIQWSEGVVTEEVLGDPVEATDVELTQPGDEHVVIELRAPNGKPLAWADRRGVWTARVSGCSVTRRRLIARKAMSPDWGRR